MSLTSEKYKNCAWAQATLALVKSPTDWYTYCALLQEHADEVLRCTGQLALRKAVESRKMEYLSLLLARGVDPNAKCPLDDQAPLLFVAGAAGTAAASADPALAAEWLRTGRVLLAYGADVNVRDIHNCTPLIQSLARGGSMDAVRLFVERFGADVNARDRYGLTALHYVAKQREVDPCVIAYLLQRGANKAAVSRRGVTPVDLAVVRGAPTWLVDMLA
jgi:ankyrin repeat protein